MKQQHYTFLFILVVLFIGFLTSPVSAGDEKPGKTGRDGSWQFDVEFYAWGASIGGETATGSDLDIGFSDIIDNLDLTLMTAVAAKKDKLTFVVDAIYMDLDDGSNNAIDPFLELSNLGLKAWVVSPIVGYEIYSSKKGSINLMAGARYLWIEVDLELKDRPPLPPAKTKASPSDDVWDAIVGVRGHLNLTEQWYAVGHLDIGTGDTDLTWQALAGIGYRFDRFDMVAGYRYLKWEFDDNSALDNLDISGPMVGGKFRF